MNRIEAKPYSAQELLLDWQAAKVLLAQGLTSINLRSSSKEKTLAWTPFHNAAVDIFTKVLASKGLQLPDTAKNVADKETLLIDPPASVAKANFLKHSWLDEIDTDSSFSVFDGDFRTGKRELVSALVAYANADVNVEDGIDDLIDMIENVTDNRSLFGKPQAYAPSPR